MATFEVNPEAHDKAKLTGDYGADSDKAKAAADVAADTKPVISTEDPGTDTVVADAEKTPAAKQDPTKEPAIPAELVTQLDSWTAEFMEKGELSDESRASVKTALFAPNVPQIVVDEYIDNYINGQTIAIEATLQEGHALVGGAETYKSLTEWAASTLPEAEIAAYDADVLGNDKARRDSAILGLHARYNQAKGLEPDHEPDLTHRAGRAAGDPIIGSRKELVRIMSTKEYKTDPAVQARVERQLRQSMSTGKYIND